MKIPLIFSVNIFGLRSRNFLCFLSQVMNFLGKWSAALTARKLLTQVFAFLQPLFIWGLITHKVENIMTDVVQLKQIQTFCCCKMIPRPAKSRHRTSIHPITFIITKLLRLSVLNRTPTTFIITVACNACDSRRLYPPTMIINISRQVKDWKGEAKREKPGKRTIFHL